MSLNKGRAEANSKQPLWADQELEINSSHVHHLDLKLM